MAYCDWYIVSMENLDESYAAPITISYLSNCEICFVLHYSYFGAIRH